MTDNFSGTIVTTRIRLARNIRGYNFRATLRDDLADHIVVSVAKQIEKYCKTINCPSLNLYRMRDVQESVRGEFVERYVISKDLMHNVKTGAVLMSDDESISLMINEEDHIRAQSLQTGNNLTKAYKSLMPLDGWLDRTLGYAKSNRLGYLTACPSNVGTGLRASAMMFLPALSRKGLISEVIERADVLGLTVRGAFGEGSDSDSCLYQVSNEVTLGKSEAQILDEVQRFVTELATRERYLEQSYYELNRIQLEDEVFRAYALLTNCRILEYKEFSKLLSSVKFGAMLKLIEVNEISDLDYLLVNARDNTLTNSLAGSGEMVNDQNISIFRASYVRECLTKMCKTSK